MITSDEMINRFISISGRCRTDRMSTDPESTTLMQSHKNCNWFTKARSKEWDTYAEVEKCAETSEMLSDIIKTSSALTSTVTVTSTDCSHRQSTVVRISPICVCVIFVKLCTNVYLGCMQVAAICKLLCMKAMTQLLPRRNNTFLLLTSWHLLLRVQHLLFFLS